MQINTVSTYYQYRDALRDLIICNGSEMPSDAALQQFINQHDLHGRFGINLSEVRADAREIVKCIPTFDRASYQNALKSELLPKAYDGLSDSEIEHFIKVHHLEFGTTVPNVRHDLAIISNGTWVSLTSNFSSAYHSYKDYRQALNNRISPNSREPLSDISIKVFIRRGGFDKKYGIDVKTAKQDMYALPNSYNIQILRGNNVPFPAKREQESTFPPKVSKGSPTPTLENQFACPTGYHKCNKEDFAGKHETDQGLLAMCLKGRIEDRDCGYYDVIECLCTHDKIILPHEIDGCPLRYNQTRFVNSHIKSIIFEYGINAPEVGQTWQFIGCFDGKLLDNLTELKTVYIPRGFIYVQGNRVVKVRRYEAETMPEFVKENIENIEKEYRKHYNELKRRFNRQVPVSEIRNPEATFPPKASKVSPKPVPENQIGDPAFYSLMVKTFSAYPEMVTDRKRLSGLLRDVCPDRRKEINVLLQVFDLGIIEELKRQSEITHLFIHRITKTLVEDYGTNEDLAKSMVSVWCLCYGRDVLHLKCNEL